MQNEISLVLAVLLFAYFIRGLTGFGSALVAVPVLALFQPLQVVVPVVLALDFVASFILGGISGHRQADWREIGLLLPFGLIGASFGVYALMRFPASPVLVALAIFAIYFGIRHLFGIQAQGSISRFWAIPAGIIGSGAGALFGTSAPTYIIYLTHRLTDKSAVRATFSWLFVVDGGFRLTLFAGAGLFHDRGVQNAFLYGLAPMMLGLFLGGRTHVAISRESLLRFVGAILLGSGCSLIFKVVQ